MLIPINSKIDFANLFVLSLDTDLVPENYEATTTDQEQPNPHEFKYIHTNGIEITPNSQINLNFEFLEVDFETHLSFLLDDTMKFGNDEVEQQVTPYEFTSEEDDTNIAGIRNNSSKTMLKQHCCMTSKISFFFLVADFDETISSKSNNNERIDIIEANAGEQQNNLADNFYFEFGEDDIMATPSLCNLDDNFYSDLPPLIE